MKTLFTILVVTLPLLIVGSCGKSQSPKRDILLESVKSMDDVFDTPIAKGKHVFSRYCSVCHGPTGKGDGFNAFNLDPKPRDFTNPAFRAGLDTSRVRETITNGGGSVGLSSLMPPWGRTLTESDIGYVTDYITSLAMDTVTADQ